MAAVQKLCHNALWLDHGDTRKIGSAAQVVEAYTDSVRDAARSGDFGGRLTGDNQVTLLSYEVTEANGRSHPPPGPREDVVIHVRVDSRNRIAKPAYAVIVYNEFGVLMTGINTVHLGITPPELPIGESTIRVRINRTNFMSGHYTASFWVLNPAGHVYAASEHGITFEISQVPIYGTTYVDHRWGVVYCDFEFSATPTVDRESRDRERTLMR
jgi:hypothetical protein